MKSHQSQSGCQWKILFNNSPNLRTHSHTHLHFGVFTPKLQKDYTNMKGEQNKRVPCIYLSTTPVFTSILLSSEPLFNLNIKEMKFELFPIKTSPLAIQAHTKTMKSLFIAVHHPQNKHGKIADPLAGWTLFMIRPSARSPPLQFVYTSSLPGGRLTMRPHVPWLTQPIYTYVRAWTGTSGYGIKQGSGEGGAVDVWGSHRFHSQVQGASETPPLFHSTFLLVNSLSLQSQDQAISSGWIS